MFERIVYISDKIAHVKLKENVNLAVNLMNLHIVFEDQDKKILGEIDDLNEGVAKVRMLGEYVNGSLNSGVIRKPTMNATIRVINKEEIPSILGEDKEGNMLLGVSPFYNDYPVYYDVNNFFSNHFAILGSTGSGKSCGIARIIQNIFSSKNIEPYKSNLIMIDSSGEYYNAFNSISQINPKYNYRFLTTSDTENLGERLRLPIWLLDSTDISQLLSVNSHSQLPIIERMLKLALIFGEDDSKALNHKNHLIAKAIMSILYSNETTPNKRNEIFTVIASCSTAQFNLESPIQGIGYTRKFRECFLIDSSGNFSESVLLTEYVTSFIKQEYDNYEPGKDVFYTLEDLERALNFTLISEGWLRNANTYGDAVTLRVRLHSLVISGYSQFFEVHSYINRDDYIKKLLEHNGKKYQFVNINLDGVDDDFAKALTKIYSNLLFKFTKELEPRASMPIHILVEEAHRYIQNDDDRFLFGFNIFNRIAKEGRKYGLILGLISQRPVELSDTVISQCSNFMIFKMNHPVDVEYIRKMIPNISDEIVEKQKTLQSGTCLGFGRAFRIPLIVKMKMPSPEPSSGNCDVVNTWKMVGGVNPVVSGNVVPNGVSNIISNVPIQQVPTAAVQAPGVIVSNSTSNIISTPETSLSAADSSSSNITSTLQRHNDVGQTINLVDAPIKAE